MNKTNDEAWYLLVLCISLVTEVSRRSIGSRVETHSSDERSVRFFAALFLMAKIQILCSFSFRPKG